MYQFFRSTLDVASHWGHHYVTKIVYDWLLYFKALIPLFILLSWSWVCPPRPYTCHIFFVPHPLMGTNINKNTKIHHVSSEAVPLFQRSLHYRNNPMMFVDHMMSSWTHTWGGNLLMQKISQLALPGINHTQAYFSYLFSLIFDLHNYLLTLCSLKQLKKY